jgi:hypothetical protein
MEKELSVVSAAHLSIEKERILMKTACTKTGPPRVSWLPIVAVVLLAIALSACAPATPEPTAVPTPVPPRPTDVPPPDQSAIIAAWEAGPHSAAYDIGKGPNTMCSRCHSPLNWKPGSKPGRAPNCVTCKFAFDKELRIAPSFEEGGMDFVSEEDWVGIPCATCHKVSAYDGTASEEIAWLNPIALNYEELNTPNELCIKCHTTPSGTSLSGGGLSADHEIILGGSAHLNYAGEWPQADRPKYCTDCHEPHSGDLKQCVDCHTKTGETHTKVAPMMEKVSCMGCHDASGATVGIAKEGGLFTTILITPASSRGAASTTEIVSHSIVWSVSCNRCHVEGNTYGLSVLTATGAPVPAATPATRP